MQRIILLQIIAFAIGFYMSKIICAAIFIHNTSNQYYPPGTQKNYSGFFVKKSYDGKGKKSEFPEGRGGGKGEPGVLPTSTKEILLTFEQKNKKCIYVNSLFSNTCPIQPFDGYKNLYEKSYQMELLEFHKKECFRKPDLFPVFALIIIITMSFVNCLCF